MTGVDLMREAALLAAACHLAEPPDQVPEAGAGWHARPEARAELRSRLQAHEHSDDAVRRRLMDELGLSAPGYWLVMLCAAVELHPEAAAAISLLTEDERQVLPTPTVLARLLRGIRGTPYEEALAAVLGGGQALAVGSVEVPDDSAVLPHSHRRFRIAADELAALLSPSGPADDLADSGSWAGLGAVVVPAQPTAAFGAEVVTAAQRLLDRRGLLVVRGRSRRGCRQLACDLAGERGRAAALVTVPHEPERPPQLPGVAALARARAHSGDPLVVVDLHALPSVQPRLLAALRRAGRALGGLLVLVDETADTGDLAVIDAPAIDHLAAHRVWANILEDAAAGEMALQFHVGIEEAISALREVEALGADSDDEEHAGQEDDLAARVRAQGARRMGRHVSVVSSTARLADLVVPGPLGRQLDEILSWHRSSHRVRWDMALGAGDPAGTGLTCLFSGKSGTGKTFAARCLANELGLNLYKIDLSEVVSKFIGETEKALAQIFDEVEAGHGLLLFDEADALFGRRSEVKDAHDRYANIEVGYLLQRLESYEGVAVLTTNLQGNMDSAFIRRLRFILHFPAPDRTLRLRLWEQSLPPDPWREGDLRLDALADRFQLSGGAIHNIGLAAAHLAAATPSGRITLTHLTRATQRELHKAGRPADDSVFEQLTGAAS